MFISYTSPRLRATARRICRLECAQPRRTLFNLPNINPLSSFSRDEGGSSSSSDLRVYHERKILPYTRRQLYNLVADVDSYQHFVPFCVGSQVLKSGNVNGDSASQGHVSSLSQQSLVTVKEAELKVGFLSFNESYVSRVTCTPYESVEAIASTSTPLFTKLSTVWRFQPAPAQAASSNPHQTSPHPTKDTVAALQAHKIPSKSSFVVKEPDYNSESTVINNTASLTPSNAEDVDMGPTLLSIDLSYAFTSPLYAGISAAFFQRISGLMVKAFEERCVKIYGPGRW